jgi:hypothetical protein
MLYHTLCQSGAASDELDSSATTQKVIIDEVCSAWLSTGACYTPSPVD